LEVGSLKPGVISGETL